MNRLIFILAFLPLFGFGQVADTFIVYADINPDDVSAGALTMAKINTLFADFDYIGDSLNGAVYWHDSTMIMADDGEFGTQYIRCYTENDMGIGGGCSTAEKSFFVISYVSSDCTIYKSYLTGIVEFSEGFDGGTNGGKIFGSLTSEYSGDTTIWDFLLEVETADTMAFFYYYTYDYGCLDCDPPQYGKTSYTPFTWTNGRKYNLTMCADAGTQDGDASIALFIDGICMWVVDEEYFVESGLGKFGVVTIQRFDGGGGCSTGINIEKLGRMNVWWPTPAAIDAGIFRDVSDPYVVGDTIPLPLPIYCEDWTYCDDYYNGGALECADTWPVSGRTDGVCAEAGNGTATRKGIQHNKFRKGVQYYFKRKGVTYE